MNNLNESYRVLAILAEGDHAAFRASATAAQCAAEGAEVSVIGTDPELHDADQAICELVAYIRRLRPSVVVTSRPWDVSTDADRMAISQLATAAVMRAADPRYGIRAVRVAPTRSPGSTTRRVMAH
jgi:LmbE family N-acetylglucosaminyl deacetylase